MIDLVYVCSNLSAKGKKRYLCNFEKCGPFSVNWVRMGGRIKKIGRM
jgi:hypothetical protein